MNYEEQNHSNNTEVVPADAKANAAESANADVTRAAAKSSDVTRTATNAAESANTSEAADAKAADAKAADAKEAPARGRKRKNLLFIISLVVLVAAIAGIIIFLVDRHRQTLEYERLAELASATETTEATEPSTRAETSEATTEETTKPKPDIPINFEGLADFNPDIYAWLTIPDTEINYPLLHSSEDDPDFYLYNNAGGFNGLLGSIYTQSNYNKDLASDNVTVIYGHRTIYGGMFGSLGEYFDEEYRNAHSEIIIYTPEHIFTYKVIFAVTFGDELLLARFNGCESEEDYQRLLDAICSERLLPSWISEPFEGTTDARMIILSTCNYTDDQRVLIGAVLTDEQ